MDAGVAEDKPRKGEPMAAIDLLFDRKLDSERLHQVVLSVLLSRSRLLSQLLGVPDLRVTDFEWEAERRLFDLAFSVEDPSHAVSKVYVELKIDSELTKEQFQRQLQHAAKQPGSRVVYLVLGLSQILATSAELSGWARGLPASFHYVDADRFADWLSDWQPLLWNEDRAARREVRDLIVAYREALDRLKSRTKCFSEHEVSKWKNTDFYGFFSSCRDEIAAMSQAKITYEPNARGGFVGCNFHWIRLHPVEKVWLYLQFEETKIRLKLKVPDEHKAHRRALWNEAQKGLHASGLSVAREFLPTHYHSGTWMTFAAKPDVLGASFVDKKQVEQAVLDAGKLADEIAGELSKTAVRLFSQKT